MLYSILRLNEAVNGDEINFFNPSELTSMCLLAKKVGGWPFLAEARSLI